jgi:hypothetical protein
MPSASAAPDADLTVLREPEAVLGQQGRGRLTRLPHVSDRLPRVVWLLVIGRAVNHFGAFTLPFLTVALTGLEA